MASDAFPSRTVGSVVGVGGMCGRIGGMLMLLVAGGMLQWLGNFTPLFIFAGVMHPLAWIAIRALVGKNIAQIDLDKGLRTAQSPALLAMGLGEARWSCVFRSGGWGKRPLWAPARSHGFQPVVRQPDRFANVTPGLKSDLQDLQ